jgi:hypothetical protein
MPDARVSHDALAAEHHIRVRDYVLMRRGKRIPVRSKVCGGAERTTWRETTTLTWSMDADAMNSIYSRIDACCRRGFGVGNLLAEQRRRPLFAGIRGQVIQLHRYARDEVCRVSPQQRGGLLDMRALVTEYLPKMIRVPVYDDLPRRVRDVFGRN